jgi:general secretion pathway protein D
MAGGRTAVIGGIVTSDRTEGETSVPFLGDIPVFGWLFRRNREIEVRRTLYIFITPYILYDESFGDLQNMTQERIDKLIFEQGAKPDPLMDGLKPGSPPDPQPRSTFRFLDRPKK